MTLRLRNTKPAIPANHYRRNGGSPLVNDRGEINASSKRDLLQNIAKLMEDTANDRITSAETTISKAEAWNSVVAAYRDRASNRFEEVGAELVEIIQEQTLRDGVMRTILSRRNPTMNNTMRVPVDVFQTVAVIAGGEGHVQPQVLRDKMVELEEFPIAVNVRLEEREINQGSPDLMDRKRNEGIVGIMVAEDKYVKTLSDEAAGIFNPIEGLVGGLNRANFAAMRERLNGRNLMASTAWISTTTMNLDIVGGDIFADVDPVTQYEMVRNGRIGNMFGVEFLTDAHRHPTMRVLNSNDVYIYADPETLGVYMERNDALQMHETDEKDRGSPMRGWYIYNYYGIAILNAHGVVRGLRS